LLEGLYDAPRAASFRGMARHGQHRERMREAIDRLNRRRGRARVVIGSLVGPGADPPSGFQEAPVEFWYSDGDWRVDQDRSRTVSAAGKVLRFHPGMGGVIAAEDEQPTERFEVLAMYFAPALWLGSFRFRIIEETAHHGRPCWHVRADPIETRHLPMPMLILGALDFELWIDRVMGIVLRCEGRLDGDLASRFIVDDLVVGEPIDPEVFSFETPDGSPIRTQGEMWLQRLRSRGVDVSGIDPSDPDAVQQAMQANFRPFHQPADVEQLAAQYTPSGPPPEDEERAGIDVGAVFQAIGQLSDDASTLVNVEGGENLGPCDAEVRKRFPTSGDKIVIDKIKFLNSSEAVVWFRSAYFPTRQGRAVLVGERWKVSRPTYCGLVAMAGLTCPPPPALS
jgi:hypothetical protein